MQVPVWIRIGPTIGNKKHSEKVTNFNRVWARAVSNHLAKTASKSVHPFDWNFVHKQSWTDRHTQTQTDTQTNWSENITPPQFRGGVNNADENCAIGYLIQTGNSYCRPLRSAKGVSLKFHPKDVNRNWYTNTATHPNTNRARQCLTRPCL